jgi:hypothetical protein
MLRLTHLILAGTLAACGADDPRCVLDGDCPGREVCVIGRCVLPSGPEQDAGRNDDAGHHRIDSGAPIADTGEPRPDSGLPTLDAGTPGRDTGTPRPDSGPPLVDAGSPLVDAGRPPATDSGVPRQLISLVVSEVLYDVTGRDLDQEWVELYNGSRRSLNLSGYSIAYGGTSWTHGTYQLMGILQPGACVVVGGPTSSPNNGSPAYYLARAFEPPIQNAGRERADGIAVFNLPAAEITGNSIPIDTVLYGVENLSELIDSDGNIQAEVNVGDAPANSSIERIGDRWTINPAPTPGDCSVR